MAEAAKCFGKEQWRAFKAEMKVRLLSSLVFSASSPYSGNRFYPSLSLSIAHKNIFIFKIKFTYQ